VTSISGIAETEKKQEENKKKKRRKGDIEQDLLESIIDKGQNPTRESGVQVANLSSGAKTY